ncbi:hypothetical protein F5877DRAFT_86313, partial [Lentinula edodes]
MQHYGHVLSDSSGNLSPPLFPLDDGRADSTATRFYVEEGLSAETAPSVGCSQNFIEFVSAENDSGYPEQVPSPHGDAFHDLSTVELEAREEEAKDAAAELLEEGFGTEVGVDSDEYHCRPFHQHPDFEERETGEQEALGTSDGGEQNALALASDLHFPNPIVENDYWNNIRSQIHVDAVHGHDAGYMDSTIDQESGPREFDTPTVPFDIPPSVSLQRNDEDQEALVLNKNNNEWTGSPGEFDNSAVPFDVPSLIPCRSNDEDHEAPIVNNDEGWISGPRGFDNSAVSFDDPSLIPHQSNDIDHPVPDNDPGWISGPRNIPAVPLEYPPWIFFQGDNTDGFTTNHNSDPRRLDTSAENGSRAPIRGNDAGWMDHRDVPQHPITVTGEYDTGRGCGEDNDMGMNDLYDSLGLDEHLPSNPAPPPRPV